MTGFPKEPRLPGHTLLRIARYIFDEPTLADAVEPTISDLQREVAAADTLVKRVRARYRGYLAFWTVAAVAPFASWATLPDQAGAVGRPVRVLRLMMVVLVVAFLVSGSPGPLAFLAVIAGCGGAFAIAIHRWNTHHPSELPAPPERRTETPQINFSSTEVAGNAGGLIFVIGTVFIVSFGFPGVMGFLVAALITGAVFARWLIAWHARHPRRGLPAGRIAWR